MNTRTYIQLPLLVFRKLFPAQAEQLPPFLGEDPQYIVRYDYVSGLIEVGYAEDSWTIQ